MTEISAVRLAAKDASQLGPLRTLRGLEVCEEGDRIWLRTGASAEALQKALRGLPRAELFSVLAGDQLCRIDSNVPQGYLPQGPWSRLTSWLSLELPTAALPSRLQGRAALRLVPSQVVRDPNLLLTSLATWTDYGSQAPQVRLDRWHFAVSARGEVVVRGLPLPPLPGMRLIEDHGVAVPCGRHWAPAIDAEVLGPFFGLSRNDVLLWTANDRRERIASDQFVRATRSAIRNSARTISDDR
jgi:hypothetical protein